jgi:hypothetical protein
MNDTQYRELCLEMAASFTERLTEEAERSSANDPIRELAAGFRDIAGGEGIYERGPGLIRTLFANCPDLAPMFPRDLLWFLGGDCLHLMSDEELASFQLLDEKRTDAAARGELLDYHEERAKLLNLQ